MKGKVYLAVIFTLGLAIGGGLIYVLTQHIRVITDITDISSPISGNILPDRNLLYKNSHYQFSLRYPPELIFQEFDEGEGATTIVFQKKDDEKVGFQIYITPYAESTITGERILYDTSGTVSDLKEEYLRDDFLVATFFSHAPLLGDIREIWFLNGGYLFEVTTYAELDTWVRDIVKTVKFGASS